MPADLAAELAEASHWYAGEPEMVAFLAQARAGHPWTPRRPYQLLDWAEAHRIPVFGCQRFVLMMNAGFDAPDRRRSWRLAVTELRRCLVAIARDEESALAYAGDHSLLSFGDEPPRRWGATEREIAMTALVFPSFAGPAPEAAGAPPPPAAPAGGPSASRGEWLTRRG